MPWAIGDGLEAECFNSGYLEARSEDLLRAAHCQSSSEERIGVLMAVFMSWVLRCYRWVLVRINARKTPWIISSRAGIRSGYNGFSARRNGTLPSMR